MFLELKNQINEYNEGNGKNVSDLREKDKNMNERINDLESQLELLKQMGGSGGGDGGQGLLGALNDITDKMRKEFDGKLDELRNDLLKRIEALEAESREKDADL